MFADACLQCYRKSSCALTLRITVVMLNPHPVPLIASGWKTLMQTHTLTEYLGAFLLNDQRSDIITSFLIVFGVCAVTVWKLSREQTNT